MKVTGSVSGSASGLLSIEGDGDKIDVTQVLTEGTKIATITINEGTPEEESVDLYAPEGFSGSWNDLTDKPTLFSGSYNDLSNKPTYNGNTFTGNMFTYNFSTSEQRVGTWIDGKPLYQKTLTTLSNTTLVNTDYRQIEWDNEPSNIDVLVNAFISNESPNTAGLVRFAVDNDHIKGASYVSNYNFRANNIVTFLYTKSTDQVN